jgi:hypothetical protein
VPSGRKPISTQSSMLVNRSSIAVSRAVIVGEAVQRAAQAELLGVVHDRLEAQDAFAFAFRSCLPRPRGPIVPARRVVVRTACRLSPQLRVQAALSFIGLPRQPGGGVLHPTRTGSASWRTWVTWNGSHATSGGYHGSRSANYAIALS